MQLGVTFKENCSDFRNSKSIELYKLLKSKFKKVEVYDPVINKQKIAKEEKINFIKSLKYCKYDVIIISVMHDHFIKKINFKKLIKNNSFIFSVKTLPVKLDNSIKMLTL